MLALFASQQTAIAAAALQLPWPTGLQHGINGGNTYGCDTHTTDPAGSATAYNADKYAIDFQFLLNEHVSAVAGGTVVVATNQGDGYGNKVVIDHGGGYTSTYAHLNGFAVSQWTVVTQGNLVGYAGGSGGYPVHLHMHMQLSLSAYRAEPMSAVTGFGWYGYSVENGVGCSGHPSDPSPSWPSQPSYAYELADYGVKSRDGRWYVMWNTGSGFIGDTWNVGTGFSEVSGDTGAGRWDPFGGDFNNNGKADYGVKSRDGRWYVVWNSGNGLFGSTWNVGSGFSELSGDTGGGRWDVFAGDFDGDGDDDYGVKSRDGRWYVVWNNGNGFFGATWNVGSGFSEISGDTGGGRWDPFAGDFNGDGKDDYAVKSRDGRWYVVWNSGNGTFGATWNVGSGFSEVSGDTGAGRWDPFAGDFDASGKDDYGVKSRDGRWYVIWNSGNGTFGATWYINGSACARFPEVQVSCTPGTDDTGSGRWDPFAGDY